MDFFNYYETLLSIQKTELIKSILKVTNRAQPTFHYWIRNKRIPDLLVRAKIAEILQKEIIVLFPNQDNN
jgi:hypothetical protein